MKKKESEKYRIQLTILTKRESDTLQLNASSPEGKLSYRTQKITQLQIPVYGIQILFVTFFSSQSFRRIALLEIKKGLSIKKIHFHE